MFNVVFFSKCHLKNLSFKTCSHNALVHNFFLCKKHASVPSPWTILIYAVLIYFPPKDVHSSRVNRTSRRRLKGNPSKNPNCSFIYKYKNICFLPLFVEFILIQFWFFVVSMCASGEKLNSSTGGDTLLSSQKKNGKLSKMITPALI